MYSRVRDYIAVIASSIAAAAVAWWGTYSFIPLDALHSQVFEVKSTIPEGASAAYYELERQLREMVAAVTAVGTFVTFLFATLPFLKSKSAAMTLTQTKIASVLSMIAAMLPAALWISFVVPMSRDWRIASVFVVGAVWFALWTTRVRDRPSEEEPSSTASPA